MDLKSLTYIEIDIAFCGNTYGVSPCTASGSGDAKCFNTRNFNSDCQDIPNYTESSLTVRFGIDCGYLPSDIPCIPSLTSADVQNAKVEPGVSIGERSTLSCTFKNHRSGDAGLDPYISDRTYNPFTQGTFWGKFKARNSYLQGRPIRILRGYLGQSLSEFRVENFIIDKISGPNANGEVSISATDFMRYLSDKAAQAPAVSLGYLATDITDVSATCTLEPTGVGDEYPASGYWSFGEELIAFSKVSGDNFNITRGQNGTTAEAHQADEVAQIALIYEGLTCAEILYDLAVNYSPLDASYCDLDKWQLIVESYSDTLYGATIVKPTAVEVLFNELIEQAGLVVFGNTEQNKIEFDVLRPTTQTGAIYTEKEIVSGSFRQVDQPKKRFSQVWIFYNQRDVYKNLDEPTNFYSGYVSFPAENNYPTHSYKKIYSRWIPTGARTVASDVASRANSRYINPPRAFQFSLFAGTTPPKLGQTLPISTPQIEDVYGAQTTVPIVITGVASRPEGYQITAEELKFDETLVDLSRTILIDYNTLNVNLRDLYDQIYSTVPEGEPITFIVAENVIVGSSSVNIPALTTGLWPDGVTPTLVNYGYIVGRGGDVVLGGPGMSGGDAIHPDDNLVIDNLGVIGGGGGAGGSSKEQVEPFQWQRGGGGAGSTVGAGSVNGTTEFGGVVFNGAGNGGDLGQPGEQGSSGPLQHYPGGDAGAPITDGSLISWINVGDIRGLIPLSSNILVVGSSTSPRINAYSLPGMSRIADPATLPTSTPEDIDFGLNHFAVVFGAAGLYIYNESDFTQVSSPATLPVTPQRCHYSHDGNYLAVSSFSSPYVIIYDTTTTPYSKLSDPGTLPTGSCFSVKFNNAGDKLAVGYNTDAIIYNFPSLTVDGVIDLPGTPREFSWNSDDSLLAVGMSDGPTFAEIYETSGYTLEEVPAVQPAGGARSCSFISGGNRLVFAHATSPYLTVYDTNDWSKIADPSTIPSAICYGIAASDDGSEFTITTSGTEQLLRYKSSSLEVMALPELGDEPAGGCRGVSYNTV